MGQAIQPHRSSQVASMPQSNLPLGAIAFFAVLSGANLAVAGTSDRWHVTSTGPSISEEIRFSNAGAELVGTVYLPASGDHLPSVVVLHSAGADTREAGLYRHLREGLPAMGVAVLIYDRRGSGQSSGNLAGTDFETLADDAIAGQRALEKIPLIDSKKIGFWGLSRGGWLAVLASERSPDAAFAISVSAPLVSAEEQMEFATSNLLLVRGYSQADVDQMLAARKTWVDYLHSKNSREAALDALSKVEAKPWFALAYLPRAAAITTDPEHDSVRRRLDDDPIAVVRKTKIPLLFLYGDSDPWIPVAESIEKLRPLRNELHNIDYAVVPNANHEMMLPGNETMQVDQDTNLRDEPQATTYFMLLASWLARNVLR